MKKLLAILLSGIMILSIVGCSNKQDEKTSSMDLTNNSESTDATEDVDTDDHEDTDTDSDEISAIQAGVKSYFANKPDHSYLIGQADLVELVKAGEDIVVLDIRQADAYAEGHLKGAINVPWGKAISDNLTKIPQDKDVYIYCYSGQTAGQAVMTLNLAGINARSAKYGWNFGLSKVEGIADVTETTENTFGEEVYEVDSEVAEKIAAYYTGLGDVADTKFKNYKVSEDNLAAMLESGEDFFLMSIRKPDDFAIGHIQGAVNIPYGKGQVTNLSGVPMDKKVVVYCYSGQTAGQTVAALKFLGYDAVSLNGGLGTSGNEPLGWCNQGYELVADSAIETGVKSYFANKPDHSYLMGQEEFVELVKADEEIVVLDIRQPDAYAEGHVKGAINVPWGTAISDDLSKIPQDKDVYIYCYSGQTAGQAVMTMNLAGINARSVKYGWNFGISKVEGVEDITETETNTFDDTTYEVNAEIAEALAAYYAGLADVADTRYKNYKVSEDNLVAMLDAEEDFLLLSIRKADDYAAGHIEGAELLPYGKTIADGFASLPMDKPIVVYCYSGQTAGQTVAALRLLGYDAVSLNGGVGTSGNEPLGWCNKGYELVQ